jgi:putative DNA primase/helicase
MLLPQQLNAKIILLRGLYNNDDYQLAKTPINKRWNEPDYTPPPEEEIKKHLAKGGWIGMIIPKGYILVDVDSKVAGSILSKMLKRLNIQAIHIETPRGWQFIFKDTNRIQKQMTKVLTPMLFVVDYRLAEKGYTVVPTEGTEKRYLHYIPENNKLDYLPWWLEGLERWTAEKINMVYDIPIKEGMRNNILFAHACRLRYFGFGEDEIRTIFQLIYENGLCEWQNFSERELETIIKSSTRYSYDVNTSEFKGLNIYLSETAVVKELIDSEEKLNELKKLMETIEVSDYWNGKFFATLFKNKIRFVSAWDNWLIWNGKKWTKETKLEHSYYGTLTSHTLYQLGITLPEDKQKLALKNFQRIRQRGGFEAMLSFAKIELDTAPEELDSYPHFLNLENGILNLETGDLLPHDYKFLLTKQMNVSYEPNEKGDRWKTFLKEITENDKDKEMFLQKAVGYSLTEDTSEDLFFILYGIGANGKSTFLNTIFYILGDYAMHTPINTFLEKKGGEIRSDLARLQNARFVYSTEAQRNMVWNEALIKQLCGRDPITARFLYGKEFTYHPKFKIWLALNVKPTVKDTTEAFWRRVCIIPFTYVVPEDKRDPYLEQKLKEEKNAIFNWMFDGYCMWKIERLKPFPKIIQENVDIYRQETDVLNEFLTSECVWGKDKKCYLKDLYEKYKDFVDETERIGINRFSQLLQERGLITSKVYSSSLHKRITIVKGIAPKEFDQKENQDDLF